MRSRSALNRLGVWLVTAVGLWVGGCDDDSVELPTFRYEVGLHLGETGDPLGALQFDVTAPANGEWVGAARGVSCEWVVDAELRGCNARSHRRMTCAVVDRTGFTGSLTTCDYISSASDLTARDFDVDVVDASTPNLVPIDVDVGVTADLVTPTSTSTTTTDPDNPTPEYSVVFDVGATSAPIGALQFEVTPADHAGGWLGVKASVNCQWLAEYDVAACNDKGGGRLTCAYVDTDGLTGPAPLIECGYASFDALTTDSFNVEVVDASSPDLEPIDVTVFVASVTPR